MRGVPAPIESIERIALSAHEIDAIALRPKNQRCSSAGCGGVHRRRERGTNRNSGAGGSRPQRTGRVTGAYGARVFGEIALAAARASLDFWRTHGAESGRQAVGARRELVQERTATDYLDEAVAVARRAQPLDRFGRFGQLVAGGAGFEHWVVAVADSGSFVVAASSSGRKQFDLGETSAMAESFRRRIVIARWRDRDQRLRRSRQEIFRRQNFRRPLRLYSIRVLARSRWRHATRAHRRPGRRRSSNGWLHWQRTGYWSAMRRGGTGWCVSLRSECLPL